VRPSRSARSTIASAASTEWASGFSTITCLPAERAASAIGWWVSTGVQIATASTSGSSITWESSRSVRIAG
jgi:hypothetical protein